MILDLTGTSFFDSLAPGADDTARVLIERAITCSRLAKRATRGVRAKLYRLKNENIRAALIRDRNALQVNGDVNLYPGLLSIRVRGHPTLRVHTHENWIYPSAG